MANTALPWTGLNALLEALAKRADSALVVEVIRARPWSSMKLSGARFCFSLWIEGPQARDQMGSLTSDLNDTEFDLEDYFLADIFVTTQTVNPAGASVEVKALILASD